MSVRNPGISNKYLKLIMVYTCEVVGKGYFLININEIVNSL